MQARELVFLLEERSAQALLETLLPRFLDPRITPRFVTFEGKQDLDKQLERRLRGYRNPNVRFVVLRDQDGFADCRALKARLWAQCVAAGRAGTAVVRLACCELEAYYLADLAAVEQALGMPALADQQARAKFRAPDALGSPSHELHLLTKGLYQKVDGSRRIGQHLDLNNGRSPSFACLVGGIRRLADELLALPD